jgi:ferric-dicitrate binding protein FerR (iron transport regulator)
MRGNYFGGGDTMMDAPEQRLQTLLESIIDGTCSDEERQEFASLVENHLELVTPLIEQLRTHSLLQWQCDEINADDLHVPAEAREALAMRGASTRRTRRVVLGWIGSIAAVLIVASGAIVWNLGRFQPKVQLAVAEVVEDSGVVWSDATTALRPGRQIYPGKLEIEAGALTLRFRSGATVLFRGAASMRIKSDMLVLLDRGQATAQVPHWAKGFTIETADVEVIDLGTQFGVMARGDGATDVVIFEGQVDVKPTGGSKRVQRRLDQGEAASISSRGTIHRIVEVRGDVKGGWSTSNDLASKNAFKTIRDNIPPSDGTKYYYYQITTGGLVDDASAYVDRHPHEWNGLTAAGLPKFLRGADYTRTFNDYRYIAGFEIVVELARPADLYVLFDDRVPTPDWLLERFENTGVKIGLDEGPWEGIPDHRTAVGSGNSIDNVFTVWRRRCLTPEEVTLGAVGESSEARAMYGIAAVPIELARTVDGPN